MGASPRRAGVDRFKDELMSTYMPKPGEIERKWRVIDASGQVLGRLAARIATILQGKDKATYTPHVDTGDFVIVINAEKVRVTGRKAEAMEYQTYSKYPSGLFNNKFLNCCLPIAFNESTSVLIFSFNDFATSLPLSVCIFLEL